MNFPVFVHELWEGMTDVDFNTENVTDQDVRNAVIDMLRSRPTSRMLYEYSLEMQREREDAESGLSQRLHDLEVYHEELREEWYLDNFGMSEEYFSAREEEMYRRLADLSEQDIIFIQNLPFEENSIQQKTNDYERENQGGDRVLPETRSDDFGGGEAASIGGSSPAGGAGADYVSVSQRAHGGGNAAGVQETQVGLEDSEADEFLARMESNAVSAPIIELNPTTWNEQFGDDGKVDTHLGEVKMGANQIAKLFEKGRSEQFGMIRPTLESPLAIIEVPSEAVVGSTERATSFLFVKTFIGKNGEKVYYFKSVTVKKDGMEVSVSSHYDRPKRIKEALKKGSCYTDLTVTHRPNNALPMFL